MSSGLIMPPGAIPPCRGPWPIVILSPLARSCIMQPRCIPAPGAWALLERSSARCSGVRSASTARRWSTDAVWSFARSPAISACFCRILSRCGASAAHKASSSARRCASCWCRGWRSRWLLLCSASSFCRCTSPRLPSTASPRHPGQPLEGLAGVGAAARAGVVGAAAGVCAEVETEAVVSAAASSSGIDFECLDMPCRGATRMPSACPPMDRGARACPRKSCTRGSYAQRSSLGGGMRAARRRHGDCKSSSHDSAR